MTIIFGLAFFSLFVWLVVSVSGEAEIKNQIANTHVLFNVLGVLLFVSFVPFFEKLLNSLLPEKAELSA